MPELVQKGQNIRLRGLTNPTDEIYEVVSVSKHTATIKKGDLQLQTHISRIAEIVSSDPSIAPSPLPEKHEVREVVIKNKPIKESKPVPFDIEKWAEEHGGIHLVKKSKFDHDGYELSSHVALDETNGFFYTLNVYKYPDGTISRGKRDSGGNKYPLKGSRLSQPSKVPGGEPRVVRGSKTAQEVLNDKLKDGYVYTDSSKKLVGQNIQG